MALSVGDAYISMTVDRSSLSGAFSQGRKEATAFGDHVEKEVSGISKSFSSMGEMARGVFQGIGQSVAQMGLGAVKSVLGGVKGAVLDLNNEAEAATAKINAFTKNSAVTAEILEKVRVEASKTPFAFQEMANAMGSLLPVAKGAGVSIDDLIKQAEILAASNPLQGLEGASFSLREAMNGDFGSIIERFDLSRVAINKWKEEGKSNMEIVSLALQQAGYDGDLVSAMGETMAGRWSTLSDTIDKFKITASKPIFDVLKNGLVTVQGYLETNSGAIEKYAGILGGAFARGMSVAGNYVKGFLDNFMGVNALAAKGGTPIEQFTKKLRDGFAWVKEAGTAFYDTMRTIVGGVQELYSVLFEGDFTGAGPWEEDSPLMTGLFTFREYVQKAMDKYDELREKLGMPLPSAMGKTDLPGMSGAQMAGVGAAGALAVGGVAAGALALAPALSPVVSIMGNLVPMLGSVVGALGPVGLALGAVALAAGGLYLAWNNNLFGFRDTVQSVFPEVESTIAGFKDWLTGAFDNIAALTEPLRTDFLGFWTNELSPALTGVGESVIGAFDRIRDSVVRFANSEGLKTFAAGVKDMADAVMPIVLSVAGTMRDDLGPAILAVVRYVGVFADEFGKAAANVIDTMGPFFGWIGTQLKNLAGFITDHSETITTVLRAGWDTISGIVKTAWDLVSGIVLTGLKLLQGDWSGAWDTIRQTLSTVWQDIKDVLYAATEVIAGILDLFLAGIKSVWEGAWKWMGEKLSELSGAMSTTLTNWSNGMATFLDTNAAKIKTAIMSPFEAARDAIGGVFSAFVSNIKAPLNDGLKAFNTFGGGLANVLSWIAGKLKVDIAFGWTPIPELATGTGPNWSGGMAWVGDGNGGSGAELAYLAPGSHVIPHEQSMGLVKSGVVPMFGQGKGKVAEFALGLDGIPGLNGLVDFFTKGADKVVNLALDTAKIAIPNIPGVEGGGGALFNMAKEWIISFVKEKMGAIFPQGGDVLTKALAAAEAQLGKPYQWGGNGDPSFDCSGFVKYVTESVGLATGMPRVVSDIYGWAAKGKNPMFTFGFNNPGSPDPRVQHMGVGIGTPGGGMQWYEAGGRAGGIGKTDDYWSEYGYPPGLEKALASMQGGPGGAAPFNSQAPAQVVEWLLGGMARSGGPSSWLAGADIIAKNESNYDPSAVNNWDINAQNGNPSMGLMQVIRDHFAPEEDPFNPFDNVAAATRYIQRKYGDMYNVPGPKSVLAGGPYLPYKDGGWVREPVIGFGLRTGKGYTFAEKEAEFVTPASQLTGGPSGRTPSGGMAYPIRTDQLTGGARGVRPDGTPLGLSAAQQMSHARLTGQFLPGELLEDDPAITSMIAEYNRTKAGIGNGALPAPPPAPTPPPPASTGWRVRPDGTPIGLSAAQQMSHARLTGQFLPGELLEDDPAITSMIAEYNRTKAGIGNGALPAPPPAPTPPPPASTGWRVRPDGTPIGLTAAQQMSQARLTGQFMPGELMEDDPAIVAMIAEYNRGKAGINNGALPPPPTTGKAAAATPPPAGATTAANRREIVIRVVSSETLINGIALTRSIISEPIATEDLTEAITEIQARWEKGDPASGGYVPGGPGGPGGRTPSGGIL